MDYIIEIINMHKLRNNTQALDLKIKVFPT